jgi:hypothetical protein
MIDAVHATDPSPNRSIDPVPPGQSSFGADLASAADAATRPASGPATTTSTGGEPIAAPPGSDSITAAEPAVADVRAVALATAPAAADARAVALATALDLVGLARPIDGEMRINNGGSCSCCTPGALTMATDGAGALALALERSPADSEDSPFDPTSGSADPTAVTMAASGAFAVALTVAPTGPAPEPGSEGVGEAPAAVTAAAATGSGPEAPSVVALPGADSVVENDPSPLSADPAAGPTVVGSTSPTPVSGSVDPAGSPAAAVTRVATDSGPTPDDDDPSGRREPGSDAHAAGPRAVDAHSMGLEPSGVGPAARTDAAAVPFAAPQSAAGTPVSEGVLRSEHIRVLRELAPHREVQRLAVDLDGARIALRFDGDGARVNVLSDPGNRLGGTWATDVQRTLNAGMRQNGGYQQSDPEGGRRNRQAYEPTTPFDEQRAAEFARRLDSIQEI